MDSVVSLVNRLQSAATLLGDNAASAGDKSLPSLWELLPSIVVIGGQASTGTRRDCSALRLTLECEGLLLGSSGTCTTSDGPLSKQSAVSERVRCWRRRARVRARSWRLLWAKTSCRAALGL